MTRNQFEQLDQAQQIKTISKYGEFVAERLEAGNRLYLYIVNSFYVELLHELSNVNSKGLVIAKVFDDSRYWEQYAEPAQLEA